MCPLCYHLEEKGVVKVVRDFLVRASSGCWIQGCCLQGDAKPIQSFAFVLVPEYKWY